MLCKIDKCPNLVLVKARGLCVVHYHRWWRWGDPLVLHGRRTPVSSGAWEKVFVNRYVIDEATGCWVWTGARDKGGYGQLQWKRTAYRAHRLSYTLTTGEIPDGMTIDHLCFNPPCINPDHLRLLTLRENCGNKQSKLDPNCVAGHDKSRYYYRDRDGYGYCRECRRLNKTTKQCPDCDYSGAPSNLMRHRRTRHAQDLAAVTE